MGLIFSLRENKIENSFLPGARQSHLSRHNPQTFIRYCGIFCYAFSIVLVRKHVIELFWFILLTQIMSICVFSDVYVCVKLQNKTSITNQS